MHYANFGTLNGFSTTSVRSSMRLSISAPGSPVIRIAGVSQRLARNS